LQRQAADGGDGLLADLTVARQTAVAAIVGPACAMRLVKKRHRFTQPRFLSWL
jgi:hypothetical protein